MTGDHSIKSFQNTLLNTSISLESFVVQLVAKIKAEDASINSFVNIYENEAISRAREIDRKISSGAPLGSLFGTIISIKDNICYKDHLSTASSAILKGFNSVYSATVVERLIAQDAIIIGSTNCDEFGMGSTNQNSVYGAVSNPKDEKRVAGGSSGGAAASVAAGFCHVAIGSDTGGSVRQPAAFCGVYGFKPSYGRVSRYGLLAYASSFDQIGILSTQCEDVMLVLSVIEGPDEFDSTVHLIEEESSEDRKSIAFVRNQSESPQVTECVSLAKNRMSANGYHCEDITLNYFDYLVPTYYIIAMAEASSNLSRYDGVHFGMRADNINELSELYTETRTKGFGTEVKRRIMTGSFILSAGYYDAYYTKAQKVRSLIIGEVERVLEEFDYMVMPVSNRSAFYKNEELDPVEIYRSDRYTVLANLCGLPSISLPLFQAKDGSPFALQVHTSQFYDHKLLGFADYMSELFQN